jgi:general nucleoside transport system ATP-binding protein
MRSPACVVPVHVTNLLEVRGVTKTFPGVIANDNVSFDVAPGEIHALLGENGAGKSTLVQMIYGVLHPEEGVMHLFGEPYAPARPGDARSAGIGLVFQHFSLFEALTVAQNVALGMPASDVGGDLDERIAEVSRSYGLALDPRRLVGTLSVGERQRVEIVRCLLQSPRLLIMDEPTSVLTPQEVETLFETLRQLSSEGVAILYISHKLEEVRALCTAATILRHGRVVASCDPRQQSTHSLAELMIGAELAVPSAGAVVPGDVVLEVRELSLSSQSQFGVDLEALSFEVRSGELFGIGGVAGGGQTELFDALSGESRSAPDAIRLNGQLIGHFGPHQRRMLGLAAAPEERLGHAAAPDFSLAENVYLTARASHPLSKWGFLRPREAVALAADIVGRFDVRTAGVGHAARSLSGGNLQKFVVGREIVRAPKVLVVSQPTWGVDAGAAALIRQALIDVAAGGGAVLVISQDLDELMEISSQFAVIAHGRLSAPMPRSQVTAATIGALMGGTST